MIHASLEQLLDEHREIDDRARDIVRLVQSPRLDLPAIQAALDGLSALVRFHLEHEDVLVYEVAAHLRAIGQIAHEKSMSAELDLLRQDWVRYLDAWGEGRVSLDPVRFRAESTDLLRRIQDRVRVESELLYFTALRHGLIPLRDAEDQEARPVMRRS